MTTTQEHSGAATRPNLRPVSLTEPEALFRQQLDLIRHHYVQGVLAFTLVSLILAFILYQATADQRVIIWATVLSVESIVCTAIYFIGIGRFLGKDTKVDARVILTMILVQCLTYSYLPYTFIPTADPSIVVLLSMVTVCLATGSMALGSPFFLGFVASCYPSMLTVGYSLYLREEALYQWLGLAFALILIGLSWFSVTLTKTIQRSIETSYENQSLVRSLRSALDETDEANRAKSVFLASASHDLRQPLHAIGLLNASLGRTQLDNSQQEIHQHMNSALGSTREMLDALLNISKLDAGAITPIPKPFLIRNVFNKLELELAPTADEKGLVFRTRESIAAGNSDPFIVELILRNLIANAIRYTERGVILIACRKRGDKLNIEVWDTGIGIPKDQYDEIFKAFNQLSNPERDSRKGFGLGLAIAQGLAQTIDTKVHLRSAPGKGSVFWFEIPQASGEVIEDIEEGVELNRFDGVTVMVIDDDSHIRASMGSILNAWGCDCILAETPEEALLASNANNTSLLISDYRLRKGVTGKEVVQTIRATLGVKLPAIIVTGDTAAERIRDAQSTDALLLHKPASAKQMHLMMSKLLTQQ